MSTELKACTLRFRLMNEWRAPWARRKTPKHTVRRERVSAATAKSGQKWGIVCMTKLFSTIVAPARREWRKRANDTAPALCVLSNGITLLRFTEPSFKYQRDWRRHGSAVDVFRGERTDASASDVDFWRGRATRSWRQRRRCARRNRRTRPANEYLCAECSQCVCTGEVQRRSLWWRSKQVALLSASNAEAEAEAEIVRDAKLHLSLIGHRISSRWTRIPRSNRRSR